MSAPPPLPNRAHLVGLAYAIVLAGACVLCTRFVWWLLQGSMLADLGWLTGFGAVLAVLAAGEALWARLTPRFD